MEEEGDGRDANRREGEVIGHPTFKLKQHNTAASTIQLMTSCQQVAFREVLFVESQFIVKSVVDLMLTCKHLASSMNSCFLYHTLLFRSELLATALMYA
jgi:hypothetical protein